jgi:hypothetical protein
MSRLTRVAFLVAVSLLSVTFLQAQTPVDPSGHWEGAFQTPDNDVVIEVDVTKVANGALAATFSNPAKQIRSLPLSNVVLDGTSLTFEIKATGGGVFHGTLGADNRSMNGTFSMPRPDAPPVELPFHLTRVGEPKTAPVSKSPAISQELEGNWEGTLEADGTRHLVRLRLVNHADGFATGQIITDQGMEIPIALITQKESRVSLDLKNIGGSYAGTLASDGMEMVGTWSQGPFSGPLTFRRIVAHVAAPALEHAIIDRWAAAIGGQAKVASIRSTYREASIQVAGHTGTIKVWHTANGMYRKEEQIGPFSQIETFDGASGMLQQGGTAPHAMTGADLERARSTAFANWNAVFYVFFPERRPGTLAIEGSDTVVLKPEGGIDWRVTLDPQTSLPRTMMHKQGERTITVTFVEYETVDGIRFEKEIHRSSGEPRFDAVIRFTKTVINPPAAASLFSIEPKMAAQTP